MPNDSHLCQWSEKVCCHGNNQSVMFPNHVSWTLQNVCIVACNTCTFNIYTFIWISCFLSYNFINQNHLFGHWRHSQECHISLTFSLKNRYMLKYYKQSIWNTSQSVCQNYSINYNVYSLQSAFSHENARSFCWYLSLLFCIIHQWFYRSHRAQGTATELMLPWPIPFPDKPYVSWKNTESVKTTTLWAVFYLSK